MQLNQTVSGRKTETIQISDPQKAVIYLPVQEEGRNRYSFTHADALLSGCPTGSSFYAMHYKHIVQQKRHMLYNVTETCCTTNGQLVVQCV